MIEIVVMPKLGFNMDEGKLTHWYKREGDGVSKGEALFAIETDKTTIDVEATQDGFVRKLLVAEGETVPVTLPIAIVADAEEDIAAAEASARALPGVVSAPPRTQPTQVPSTSVAFAAQEASAAQTSTGVSAAQESSALKTEFAGSAIGDPAYDFDVFIIGGGPGGYVAAIRAGQLGLRVAIAEKEVFGGVCLNRGCIPTKTFLRSAEALKAITEAADYGIAGLDVKKATLDMKKVQERKQAIVNGLVQGVEGLLVKNKAAVIRSEAKIIDKHTVRAGGETYKTANLILATGSVPKDLPDGVAQRGTYLTSNEILAIDKLPKDIVIIGAGVIGVEFAYFLASAGTKVTIIEFLDRILPPIDAEIAALIRKDLEAMGIVVHTGAKVTKALKGRVEYEKDGETAALAAKEILLAVGRSPFVTPDALALGIEIDRGAIVTDDNLRTNVEGVYAIGDVNGKLMLAHTASAEGIIAAETIAGQSVRMDYSAVPSVVYIQPEAASVGLTEDEARTQYGEVKIGRFPVSANGKSRIEGDTRGMVKVIVTPEYGEIVGVHLYCLHASDMIAEAAAAMNGEMTVEDIARTAHPHPTVSETLQEAFEAALGSAIHR